MESLLTVVTLCHFGRELMDAVLGRELAKCLLTRLLWVRRVRRVRQVHVGLDMLNDGFVGDERVRFYSVWAGLGDADMR